MRLFFLFFPFLLFAVDLKEAFLDKRYAHVCREGMKLYYKREKNEAFLSMVGVACVKSDSINPLGVIVKELTETASGRQNAAYFSLLFLQKKLLYAYMFDSFDLTSYCFPLTDHPLSIAIEKIREKKYGTIDKWREFQL